ncbi:MAG: hypothetical protein AAF721_26350 [Myxococcota bacterium]
MRSFARLRLAPLMVTLALGATACSEDLPSGEDSGEGDWDVETPERFVYDDSKMPIGDLGADPSMATVPFTVVGEDSGEGGIVYSAALAGYYIMRTQWDEEGYHYQLDPVTGEWEEKDNIHRKCGATFTQAWLYRLTGREDFKWSTFRALEYLLGRGAEQDDGSFKLRDLGATALVTLSLTTYSKLAQTTEFDETIAGTGKYILDRITEEGSFTEGSPLVWAQCHQALWRLYDYTGDEAYVLALEKVGKYFSDNQDDPEVIDFPYLYGLWANEPLTDLYLERPADWISELVLTVGDDVASKQYTPENNDNEVWMGGYFPNSGSGSPNWNSTLKLEAVIDAWRMADAVGDEERAEKFRKSSLIGADFLQRMMHRKGETDDFADPALAIGGIPFSPTDPTVRVDVPHHGANAILKVAEYMDLEDYPGGPLP